MSTRASELMEVIEASRELRTTCEEHAMTARALAGAAGDLVIAFRETITQIDELNQLASAALKADES